MMKKMLITSFIPGAGLALPSFYALVTYSSYNKHELESVFDPRNPETINEYILTNIRHQGVKGICWAYSALGVAETNILKKGLHKIASSLDLSEKNLAYKTLNRSRYEDALHNTDFDNYKNPKWDTVGSISFYAATSLLQWNKLKEENGQTSNYILKDLIEISADVYDKNIMRDHIKKAVKEFRAVSVSFYVFRDGKIGTHWNPELYKYNKSGHSATIVGWDNTIPASEFGAGTKQNGGWIVKNNWGASHGKDEYFYLSYNSDIWDLYTMDFTNRSDYNNNYYYDGSYKDIDAGAIYSKTAVSF
ncbi:C1 family peptidase [Mycoplasma phocimorsus]|uniref:C1 family peptidase n=1 Tax=Mycoplasma phocimorsus TaxID=3045839 RepID=UPI0024BF6D23|nr:C1 family peptidase [Mycoplasma phocimorsus]MDJ1647711.1 C1 family peptidase [Mycoplasma phocimorsus]